MAIGIRGHNLTSEAHNVFFYDDSIWTTVTNDPNIVSDWISDVEFIHRRRLHYLIAGLDVEWRPSYTRAVENPVATLQLCVGRRCLVYQICHSPYIPESLADFLSDDYSFVGVGVKADLEKLEYYHGIGGDAYFVELGRLEADEYDRRDLRNAGLKGLARFVLEKEVEKPREVTVSRWDNRWLTAEQVKYACIDAYVSFEIGRILDASGYYC